MQNRSRHIFIPPHAKHIRAYSYFSACKTYPGIFLFPPYAEHIRAYFYSPPPHTKYIRHIFIPLPHIQNISGAYFYSPPPHTKHIRSIFLFPSPRMQTEPEHVFDCPHVCDGCTVRTDAIRHERTDVRKTRWTMKMYSGSVPSGNPFYSPAPSPSGNPIIRFPPGQHTLSYFPRAVLQIRSTHAIIPSEELSSTRSYPRLSSQRMHVFAL